jgi:putative transposase
VKLAPRSPNLNAFAERFVRTIKESCLERIVLIGEASFQRASSQFILHYHNEWNHQGLGNKIIQPEFAPFPSEGAVNYRKRLGGLLRYITGKLPENPMCASLWTLRDVPDVG